MLAYKKLIVASCLFLSLVPAALLAHESKIFPGIGKHYFFRSYYRPQNYYSPKQPAKPMDVDEWKKVKSALESLAPDKRSMVSEKLRQIREINKNPNGLAFYEPTYVLPFYHTVSVSPWYAQHADSTPDNQAVMHSETKAQLSILFPLWSDMFNAPWSLNIAYTQVNYWQLYANSPYFRETNYEPRVFFTYTGIKNWMLSAGFDHQSNGRGGTGYDGMERSWNRVFLDVSVSGKNWMVSLMPWLPVFKANSMNLHNPHITRYLGYGRVVMAYTWHGQEVSVMFRNQLESGFRRGALELSYTFPLYGKLRGMLTFFSGYGQSLIEYDHRTNAYGLGVALSDWM